MSMNENNQEGNNRSIDAARLTALFLAGAANLEAGKEWINELNVFPRARRRYRYKYDTDHKISGDGSREPR